jgi:hypothetical protein
MRAVRVRRGKPRPADQQRRVGVLTLDMPVV